MTLIRPRRTFLGFVVGAVALAPRMSFQQRTQDVPNVDSDATPADSLALYSDLLRRTHIEVLFGSDQVWASASTRVSLLVQETTRLARALEAEVPELKASAQAELISVTGHAVVATLNEGGPSRSTELVGSYGSAVSALTSQVETNRAQGLLEMSPNGLNILRRLLRALEDLASAQVDVDRAREAHMRLYGEVDEVIQAVRSSMLGAAGAIAGVQFEPSRAISLINDAVSQLETLRARPNPLRQNMPFTTALIDILKGTRTWVQALAPSFGSPSGGRGGRAPVAVLARLASANPWIAEGGGEPLLVRGSALPEWAQQSPVMRQRLSVLLDRYSPNGTVMRTLWLLALVTPVWALHSSEGERRPLIRVTLQLLPRYDQSTHSEDFITALATFV